MVVSLHQERERFARRLADALSHADIPNDRARIKIVARMFDVSRESARKWLCGETIPKTQRIIEIARTLDVNAEWLFSGRPPMVSAVTVPKTKEFTIQEERTHYLMGKGHQIAKHWDNLAPEMQQALWTIFSCFRNRP